MIIRYDPADVAEIRVYHVGHFLCRAVCADLAGETVSLKEIVGARNRRRRDLRSQLTARETVVDQLLALRRSDPSDAVVAPPVHQAPAPASLLKRYVNA